MLYLLYLLLATFFIASGYLIAGGILVLLWQPAELIIICFPSLFFAVAATSWKAFGSSWGLVFGNPVKPDSARVRQACQYLKVCGYVSIFMGLVSTFLGIVFTMHFLGDASLEIVGHHIGASLVGLIYSCIFYVLCYVAEQRIKGRYLEVEVGGPGG